MNAACLEYIYRHETCPCHPAESAIFGKALELTIQKWMVDVALPKLVRQVIDDNLILSEEVVIGD